MYTQAEYETKRNARYERLKAAALKAETESNQAWTQASLMASVIPFGQPILVGHYSEKRDRNYRARIESKHRKGYELHQKAQAYQSRAESAESNTAIYSDDPTAPDQLTQKIAELEQRQTLMKAANKLIKKNDRAGLAALGFTETNITKLFTPDFCGRIGFPAYEIANNNANLRTAKERLEKVTKRQQMETTEEKINGVTIEVNPGENRIRVYFTGRLDRADYETMQRNGFRVARSLGEYAFSAFCNRHSLEAARSIATKLA